MLLEVVVCQLHSAMHLKSLSESVPFLGVMCETMPFQGAEDESHDKSSQADTQIFQEVMCARMFFQSTEVPTESSPFLTESAEASRAVTAMMDAELE